MFMVCSGGDVDLLISSPPQRPVARSPHELSQLSFAMKKKLSASAGNLWDTGRGADGTSDNSSLAYVHMQLSKSLKAKVGCLSDTLGRMH